MTPFEDPSHPISAVLSTHYGNPTATTPERAMCRNLLAEHRVSIDRFAAFIAVGGAQSGFADVVTALEEYQKHVRPLKTLKLVPAYRLPDNAGNAVTLPLDAEVATLLDLTRLGRVYAEAKSEFKYPEFAGYLVDDPKNYTQINEFLGASLEHPGDRAAMMEAILRARERYRAKTDKWLHPTWVAEWKSLAPHLQATAPDGWLRAVGVPIEEPHWIAAFRYRVADSKRPVQLFRPTQLDVGWYAHHFPSPPAASLEQGGHAMYLLPDSGHRPHSAAHPLVLEYVHQQIDFTIQDWEFAGSLLGLATLNRDDLGKDRQKHWERLQSVYSPKPVVDWMSNCI
jgi:hypothetical protein